MANWREALGESAQDARPLMRELLDGRKVRFTPLADGSRGWSFEGDAGVGGLLSGVVEQCGWRPHRDMTLCPSTARTWSVPAYNLRVTGDTGGASQIPDLNPEEFRRLFDADAAALGPEESAILDRYAVSVYRTEHEVDFGKGPVRLPVWVVAESDHAVLGYDEAEERYGNGIVGAGGLVEWWTFSDEGLSLSVIEFQRLVEFRRRA